MRRFKLSKLFNGYFISAVFHLLLFILCAFYVIQPYVPEKWYTFEWEPLDRTTVIETHTANKLEEITMGNNIPGTEGITKPAGISGKKEINAVNGNPVSIGDSEPAIAMPLNVLPQDNAKTTIPSSFPHNRNSNALKEVPGTITGSNFGFSSSLEEGGGEAYIISQTKPQINPTEEGEVYLEFKLTPKGTVDMSSVNILSYTSATYAEAVRKVMPSWKFGFKGTYNPKQLYRLRCRFVINE